METLFDRIPGNKERKFSQIRQSEFTPIELESTKFYDANLLDSNLTLADKIVILKA